jgi:YgiT-type zinc finger domain-containing protein
MEVAMEGDRCDFCSDGRLTSRQVREYYRAGKGLVVIEKVPAYVCDKCGERYYEAHVAKQMRQLVKKAPRARARISFPLIRFQEIRASA